MMKGKVRDTESTGPYPVWGKEEFRKKDGTLDKKTYKRTDTGGLITTSKLKSWIPSGRGWYKNVERRELGDNGRLYKNQKNQKKYYERKWILVEILTYKYKN